MASGERPPLPSQGTASEFAQLYVETVGLYKRCEVTKEELVNYLNQE